MKEVKLYLIMFLMAGICWSCKEDAISDESIFKDSTKELSEFDKWILVNYTYPYNIVFKYKMEDIESDHSYQLVPADPDKSIAFAKFIKYLWLDAYAEHKGVDFPRMYAPRVIHLIGSGAYNSNNTYLLGTAEEGLKITLFRVNDFDPVNPSIPEIKDRMRTLYHEFSHILHQKKNYSEEFQKITNDDYILNDWSSSTATLQIAYEKGFVSRYARKEPNEDFVEIIARYVVYGQENWDAILKAAGTDGAAKINQKFEIVQNYLTVSWGIDINELRRVFETRLDNMDKLDLTHLD
ncbi:MAG: putative zinc-binding metallopeptidase [Dysgonamonadaceae bacterium]|jgi:substrate import-associated zinc metallohydrolase lipoprotein|nr:putative zinc-binding metallopeptidase [Dysgonamonadaceae bacterium]